MRRYHCLFLWLCVLLWYASTPTNARAQSPPDSAVQYDRRLGVRFGLSGISGKSPFLGGYSVGQLSMGFEYGKSYGRRHEWEIHARLTRQFLHAATIAQTLGFYDASRLEPKLTLQTDKSSIDGLMLGIGGKAYLGVPDDKKVVVFLRGYTGLNFMTYRSFTINVQNQTPRIDTTARIDGASTFLFYLGLNPGLEFRSGNVGLSLEYLGFQFYSDNGSGIHLFHLGAHIFF